MVPFNQDIVVIKISLQLITSLQIVKKEKYGSITRAKVSENIKEKHLQEFLGQNYSFVGDLAKTKGSIWNLCSSNVFNQEMIFNGNLKALKRANFRLKVS